MNSSLPRPWSRVGRCPCCHKSGCLVSSPTNPAAAVCTRVTSTRPIGSLGYLHELRPGPTWAKWRVSLSRMIRGTQTDAGSEGDDA